MLQPLKLYIYDNEKQKLQVILCVICTALWIHLHNWFNFWL